jgi:hypothetical protein
LKCLLSRLGNTVLMNGARQGDHWIDDIAKKMGSSSSARVFTPMISIIRWQSEPGGSPLRFFANIFSLRGILS